MHAPLRLFSFNSSLFDFSATNTVAAQRGRDLNESETENYPFQAYRFLSSILPAIRSARSAISGDSTSSGA